MDVIKWRKAQQSGDQGDACVEVARFPEAVAVRDSKNPDGPKLLLTPHTFQTILNNLKQ
ncbi:DUF397 domain-containing protein [Actinomadura bangladeshensis]|uniref:DUF397 domain-containing protein n=1 Tax=Actinomadura bangladeshensis TaxID=453573 RepID=A0A6L9QPI3_9ACTN|nr:DUF397 domain-containing protein [Actinomadura bangladeshensis]NEA27390.1 DUF397 domain-containing protein [Actinomadura bangladeshensis]